METFKIPKTHQINPDFLSEHSPDIIKGWRNDRYIHILLTDKKNPDIWTHFWSMKSDFHFLDFYYDELKKSSYPKGLIKRQNRLNEIYVSNNTYYGKGTASYEDGFRFLQERN